MGAMCVWGLWVGYTAPGHHIYKWIQARKRWPLKKKGWPARKQAASSPVSRTFRMGQGRAEGIRDWMPGNFGHSCEMLHFPVAKSCLTLCNHINCRMWGFPVLHYLPEFAQTHVHSVDDTIQPSHPLSSPSPPAFNLSQHQGLFQWVISLHQVARVLELQLQHQSFHSFEKWKC